MPTIGFWELIVIGVLGLIVLGPERLPVAVRTVSGWMRTARRMANNVKQDLAQELEIEKLHADLKKAENISDDLNSDVIPQELRDSVKSLQDAAADVNRPYDKSLEDSSETDTPPPTQNKE